MPFGGTFLIFSDYMRPPMRLAAMNGLPVIYVFTHDSIAMGEDGPTHQPSNNWWDCDRSPAWLSSGRPMLTRRLPPGESPLGAKRACCPRAYASGASRARLGPLPGYHAGVSHGRLHPRGPSVVAPPDIILIATGSEVHLALEAREQLASEGVQARVVSMPSTDLFSMQSDDYRHKVMLRGVPILAIEAGTSFGWQSYVGPRISVISVDSYGASAPGPIVMEHYGITAEYL